MPPNDRFKLKKTAILAALVSSLMPASSIAASAAGRVDFATGGAYAVGSDGARRALTRGSALASGDTIKTTSGRVHMRLSDGAYISLKPNTEFRIDEYRFEKAKPAKRRGFFSLLRGGLRTITGLIGKRLRGNYRMRTKVATIGIRGTHYGLDVGIDGEPRRTDVVNFPDSSSIILMVNPEFELEAGERATIRPVILADGAEVIEVTLTDKENNKTVYRVFADGSVRNVTTGQTLDEDEVSALLGTQTVDPDRNVYDSDDADDGSATLEDIIDNIQNGGYGN